VRLPGVRFQIQSDMLTIRSHGMLLPSLRIRERTPPPLQPAAIDIDSELDGEALPADDIDGLPIPSEHNFEDYHVAPGQLDSDDNLVVLDGPAAPSAKALGKRKAISVMSLSGSDDEPSAPIVPARQFSASVEAIQLDDSDDELPSPHSKPFIRPVSELTATEDDSSSTEGTGVAEDDGGQDEVDELASEAGEDREPHLEDSQMAFFTPPVTSSSKVQRKTKMRAFFDCGTRYLAVAKTADILAWDKQAKRECASPMASALVSG
jgi:hypothetical protein